MAKILVVDDQEKVRGVFVELLETEGHEVTQASDGQEGFEIFKEGGFSVVITDKSMPNMNGCELRRAIEAFEEKKDIPHQQRTPVILITAEHDGFDAVLPKPLRRLDILTAIVSALSS